MTIGAPPAYDAVILAGGSASRMGGVDKPAIVIAGRSMLRAALDSVARAERVVVVGPHRDDLAAPIAQTQESPAGGGPVLAMDAGLLELGDGTAPVVVLAADLPFLSSASIESLVAALDREPSAPAAFALDESGRVQFLLGVWRRDALSAGLDELGRTDLANRPMKTLIPAGYVTVPMTGISDCDTEADVAAARARGISPPSTSTRPGVPSAMPSRCCRLARPPRSPRSEGCWRDRWSPPTRCPGSTSRRWTATPCPATDPGNSTRPSATQDPRTRSNSKPGTPSASPRVPMCRLGPPPSCATSTSNSRTPR
ncbi:mobA-like NTP transferase domain protein [Rhodococcus sp. MTM3W5.2]|nr:mobA-like NTP transferase domain protein [Rhodococcus sp. MTM3W5.2]